MLLGVDLKELLLVLDLKELLGVDRNELLLDLKELPEYAANTFALTGSVICGIFTAKLGWA